MAGFVFDITYDIYGMDFIILDLRNIHKYYLKA